MADEVAETRSGEGAGAAATGPNATLCRECKKPIPAGAAKCTECGAYQDWRRFLTSWKALVAGGGASIALVVGALTLYDRVYPDAPTPARLDAELTCNQDLIVVKVTNTGGTTGTIDRPSFRLYSDGHWAPLPTQLVLQDRVDDSDLVVAANATNVLSYPSAPNFAYFREDQTGRDANDQPNCQFGVAVPGLTRPGERLCECVYRP